MALYQEQAVMAPLISPLQPIYRKVKIETTQMIMDWAPAVASMLIFLPALMNSPEAMTFLGAALPPKDSQALSNMKKAIEGMAKGRALWARTKGFMRRYITLKDKLSKGTPAWEKAAEAELDNSRLFDWLRNHSDPDIQVIAALLDIHLAAMNYPGEIHGVDAALQLFKSYSDAASDLVLIAEEMAGLRDIAHVQNGYLDSITVAAALDILQELNATAELQEFVDLFNRKQDVRESELLTIIPLLQRVKPDDIEEWMSKGVVQGAFEDRFLIHDRELVDTGLRLLADLPVHPEQNRALLAQLIDRPPHKEEFNIYTTLCMLSIFNLVTQGEKPLVQLTPERRKAFYNRLTHTHWDSPQHRFSRPTKLGQMVYRLGELLHDDGRDTEESGYMAFLLEMAFKDSLGLLTFGNLSHPRLQDENRFMQELQESADAMTPRELAELQFSGLIHAAIAEGRSSLPWEKIYPFAAAWNANNSTLHRISFEVMTNFLGPAVLGPDYSLEAERRFSHTKKGTFLPHQMFMITGNKPIFRSRPTVRHPEEYYRQKLRDEVIPELRNPAHFNKAKTLFLLTSLWTQLRQKIFNPGAPLRLPLKYLEIHPDQRCHNRCKYCRGSGEDAESAALEAFREASVRNPEQKSFMKSEGLRNVPEEEQWINGTHMVTLARDFANQLKAAKQSGFVRISGSIGDPGKNPDTWMLMEELNREHIPWGITMDGLAIPQKMIAEMFSSGAMMEWVHISLDAGSNKTYTELKKNRPYVEPRPGVLGPYDVVIFNIERMIAERKKSGSSTQIVVSLLMQNENYKEIEALAQRLKAMGSEFERHGVDVFQIKMQHFDPRRMMQRSAIDELYDPDGILDRVEAMATTNFLIEIIPRKKTDAIVKNEGQLIQIVRDQKTVTPVLASSIDFPMCWVKEWSRTATPNGLLNSCCQVHGNIIPATGNFLEESLLDIWLSEENAVAIHMDPRIFCLENVCAPQDLFMNRAMNLLHEAALLNPVLIDEFEGWLFDSLQIELRRRTTLRRFSGSTNPPSRNRPEEGR